MINKIARTIEMSFDIPEDEMRQARVASECFLKSITALDVAKKHLDIIYHPFKDATDIPADAILEYRGAIRGFKEQVQKNFNKFKAEAFKAVVALDFFSSDSHILELVNSYKDSVGAIEKQVNTLFDILDDIKSADFRTNVVAGVENIRKESYEIEKLVKERIIDHIDTNILAKDWMSNTGDELKYKIETRVPYITQLFQERQKAVDIDGS